MVQNQNFSKKLTMNQTEGGLCNANYRRTRTQSEQGR